ncbi:MAG: hypothetical protein AB1576_13155, partial [Bacillota bacterium]
FQRLIEAGAMDSETQDTIVSHISTLNPLALKRHLDSLLQLDPDSLKNCIIHDYPSILPVTFLTECSISLG